MFAGEKSCDFVCVCVIERSFSSLLQTGLSEIRLDSDLEVYLS